MLNTLRRAILAAALLLALAPCAGIAVAQVHEVKVEPPGKPGGKATGPQGHETGAPTETTGKADLHGTVVITKSPIPNDGQTAAVNPDQAAKDPEPAPVVTIEDLEAESLANELRSSRTSELQALPVIGKSRRAAPP
ncbi:MAG: hypothetical protein NT117_03195 [Gammaproteobacteria bacterium]|nr:hypothetical protein [Gammaproteobacteria bacterium]